MSGDPPMKLYVEGLTRSALSQKLHVRRRVRSPRGSALGVLVSRKTRDQPAFRVTGTRRVPIGAQHGPPPRVASAVNEM